MGVSLSKGGNVDLSKESPGLAEVRVGMGWLERDTDGEDYDLDASVFMLNANGKVPSDNHFIFYNKLESDCGSVIHNGDNKVGGSGDAEAVDVNLDKVPTNIEKIAFTVTIHDAEARRQNFGQVSNAFIRILDRATQQEVARYDLSEDSSTETAMIFGELYRHNGNWKFRAVGQGYAGGLGALAGNYGVNVG
jgi:tellurium resistance protein TerD